MYSHFYDPKYPENLNECLREQATGEMNKKFDLDKLIDALSKYLELKDYEYEHGDYKIPEHYIPSGFEDEEDYCETHGEIVDKCCDLREIIETMIARYRKSKDPSYDWYEDIKKNYGKKIDIKDYI